jgi:hypothetical protein
MKYTLFIYSCEDEWNGEVINKKIANELMPIVKSDALKYIFGDKHSIFHFESELPQAELEIYVDIVNQDNESEFMYVLLQTSKKMSSNMDPNHLKHLTTLKTPKTKKNQIKGKISEIMGDEEIAEFLRKTVYDNIPTDLTVDEILDKIHEKGIESLTISEKQKLDNYSKES